MAIETKEMAAKRKFGLLLYHLSDAGFRFDHMQRRIIRNHYFSFFEENDIDRFLGTPIETIIENEFDKKVYIDYSKPIASELFWAGGIYISILLNLGVPLQRSLLVIPIDKMLSLFSPYHEMNESKMMERYLEEESKESVLKALMGKSYSIRKLAMVTSIKERTLISYLDNEKLLNASLDNAYKLSMVFDLPLATFAKSSAYCPSIKAFTKDPVFRKLLFTQFALYHHEDPNDESLAFDSSFLLLYKKGKPLPLSEKEIALLSKLALSKFKETLPEGMLLF